MKKRAEKLPRPYIPLAVRIIVATWQLAAKNRVRCLQVQKETVGDPDVRKLARLLNELFGDAAVQLDHNPALAVRTKIRRKGKIVGYKPHANDPGCLIYREKHAHHIKTNVAGDNGQYSDTVLRKRERRRAKKKVASGKRKKIKVRSRGTRLVRSKPHKDGTARYRWAKGRKIKSAGFRKPLKSSAR
jgi:hypothetical protein